MKKSYMEILGVCLLITFIIHAGFAQTEAQSPAAPPSVSAPSSDTPSAPQVSNNPTPVDPLDKKIDGPFNVRNQDIQNVLTILQQESGMQMIIDPGLTQKVTFFLESPTIRNVLDTVLPANGLSYMILDDSVVRIGAIDTIRKLNDKSKEKVDRSIQIRKSLAVMSNVLDFMLKEKLGEEYQSRSLFAKGTRGYWIPGSGLMFVLGVKFPLIQPEEKETVKQEKRPNDLWDRFAKKINSTSGDDSETDPTNPDQLKMVVTPSVDLSGAMEFDPKKVDAVRETVLAALAKYGCRFEGFTENETITVIVEGEGNANPDNSNNTFWKFNQSRMSWDSFDPQVNAYDAQKAMNVVNLDQNKYQTTSDNSAAPSDQKSRDASVEGVVSEPDPRSLEAEREAAKRDREAPMVVAIPKPEPRPVARTADPFSFSPDEDNQARSEKVKIDLHACEEELKTRENDWDIAKKEMELIQKQSETAKQRFETGTAPQSDVLEAEKQSIAAQKFMNESQRKLVEAQSRLQSLHAELERMEKQKAELEKASQKYRQTLDLKLNDSLRDKLRVLRSPWTRSDGDSTPVMVIQIRFGDLPKQEGTAADIEGKAKITTY